MATAKLQPLVCVFLVCRGLSPLEHSLLVFLSLLFVNRSSMSSFQPLSRPQDEAAASRTPDSSPPATAAAKPEPPAPGIHHCEAPPPYGTHTCTSSDPRLRQLACSGCRYEADLFYHASAISRYVRFARPTLPPSTLTTPQNAPQPTPAATTQPQPPASNDARAPRGAVPQSPPPSPPPAPSAVNPVHPTPPCNSQLTSRSPP